MKQKLKTKARTIATHPATRRSLLAMKPDKTLWGFLGVTLFFIVPEIAAFVWGAEITSYAQAQLPHAGSSVEAYCYEGLIMLFEEGGSWINLAIGFALLVWLFF